MLGEKIKGVASTTPNTIRDQKISNGYRLIVGDDREEFLSDMIAPLFSEDMAVYQELEKDVFRTKYRES